MTDTAKREDVAESAELSDSTSKTYQELAKEQNTLKEVPPFATVKHLLAEYNQHDEQIAEKFPNYKTKLVAVMCEVSVQLPHDNEENAKALLDLIESGNSKVIKKLAEQLCANLADTSHNDWETMYLSIATFVHHVPNDLLGHDDAYQLLAALSSRIKAMLASEPTLLLPAVYAMHLLILKMLAAGVMHITEEKRTTIKEWLSAVKEAVNELVKITEESEPHYRFYQKLGCILSSEIANTVALSHYDKAMLTAVKTLLSTSERLFDEGILKTESKRAKRIKRMKASGLFVFQLARCATSWYGTVQSARLSVTSSIASTWQCLNAGRQLMSPLIKQTKTHLIDSREEACLIDFLKGWYQAEDSLARLELLEGDKTEVSEDYGYLYGMVTLLGWIDDESDDDLSSAIQERMAAYFNDINDKTVPEQQQLYDAILDWMVTIVKGKAFCEWPTVFMCGAIPQAINDYQPIENATASSQRLDCLATAWYQQFPHDETIQEASHKETVTLRWLNLFKKRIEKSPEKQSPWGASCLAQLRTRCDADSQQRRDVVATDEAIVNLQQTLKHMGCTDYQDIPRKQLERLLTLDELEREQVLQMVSQFTPESVAASGNAEVSVVQYLEDVLNRKVHYTAVTEENASSSPGSQQEPQTRTTDNGARITHSESTSSLPITLSLPRVAAYHRARVNIKLTIKDAFNVSSSGTSFVLPELSVLIAHLEILRETHLSQDDVDIFINIANTCQQNSYIVHAVCIYALFYRRKEKDIYRDTHTLQFYQKQLVPLLSQKPCEGKQIAFQSAQGTFHQPVAIQAADKWIDVALRFKQSWLMHYLLSHDELHQDFSLQTTDKAVRDGIIEVEHETVFHRLCLSGITDLSLYQRFVTMWPQVLGARTPDFHLPLHKAACFADQNVFHYLAEKTTKAWVQADSQGNTLLHLAAMYANTEAVDLLLQQGVDVNARNADKRTPLHCAAAGLQLDQGSTLVDYAIVFNSLLAQGADPTCMDSYQKTARDIAMSSRDGALLDIFDKALNRIAPERLWQYWQTAMMSYYTKGTFVKKRLFNDDYFLLADYFVNLQVIKKQDSKTNRQQSRDDKPTYQLLRERDRLAGKKEVIELGDLFQPSIYPDSDGKLLPSINTVVLSGAAGIGKTTLMDYLAYQWALFKQEQGEAGLWSAFDAVLMIRCRDLHPEQIGSDVRTITQLLHRACWGSLRLSADDTQSLLARLEQSPARCLLLLDGLDELPELKQAYWRGLLAQLFQLPFKKLVTTRPYAIGTLQKWINHDGLVEISGFTDSNVAVYFEKVLGQSNETQDFIQAIKKNPDLWAITHIPIHAYLLKSWWATTCLQEGPAQLEELSISGLYGSLIVNVCRRYLVKIGELNGDELLNDDMVLAHSCVDRLLGTLGRWAFEGLRQDTAQLPISWLSGVEGSDEGPTLLWTNQLQQLNVAYLRALGLLKQVGNGISAQQRFEFPHLSFQEFLAARTIAVMFRTGTEEEKTHIIHAVHAYKYHLNFTLVWPMVSGLLKEYPRVLNDFLLHLIAGPRDWVGFVEFELLMRCLESSLVLSTDTSILCSQQQGLLQIIQRRIQQFGILPDNWQKSILDILSTCPKLARLNAGAVLILLRDHLVDGWVRGKLAVCTLASLSENPRFAEVVLKLLQDQCVHGGARCELAASAAASFSEIPGFVEAVLTLLQDQRVHEGARCYLAVSTVALLSENPSFVEAILMLLQDPCVDGGARCDLAASVVASLSENLGFVEVVLMLLQDQHLVGRARCELAASVVASLSGDFYVVKVVLMLLQDQRLDGASRYDLAASVITSLSEKPGVVKEVLTLLQDQRLDGANRYYLAASTVASLSENPSIVEVVLILLQDQCLGGRVRGDLVASTFTSLLPENPGIVEAVFALLENQRINGLGCRRCLTASAVASLSENSGFVKTVLTLLRDPRVARSVRCRLAASAVASLPENSGIVEAVLALLQDKRVFEGHRCDLAASTLASLPENSGVVRVVLMLLQDQRVGIRARCDLAASVVASLPENPGVVAAVLTLLKDQRASTRARRYLAASAVASLPENPDVAEVVLILLQDQHVARKDRCHLAASVVASLSKKPGVVGMVLMLLRDQRVDVRARCNLAASAVASLSKNPGIVKAVLTLLQDPRVGTGVCYDLAQRVVALLSENSGVVEVVLILLQDQRVDLKVRCNLAASAFASLSENPDIVEAVLRFLRDQSMDVWFRRVLAARICQHCVKWPNKTLTFLDSLFVKGRYEGELSGDIDIPVHVILPLYEKTHEQGRKYIKAQLVKHRVLVYDRAETVLVRQAGQTEHLKLSLFTIKQVKQAQLYRLTFDDPASSIFHQEFFAERQPRILDTREETRRQEDEGCIPRLRHFFS